MGKYSHGDPETASAPAIPNSDGHAHRTNQSAVSKGQAAMETKRTCYRESLLPSHQPFPDSPASQSARASACQGDDVALQALKRAGFLPCPAFTASSPLRILLIHSEPSSVKIDTEVKITRMPHNVASCLQIQ